MNWYRVEFYGALPEGEEIDAEKLSRNYAELANRLGNACGFRYLDGLTISARSEHPGEAVLVREEATTPEGVE